MDKIDILRNIQNKKAGGLVLTDKLGDTVAIVLKKGKKKYVNQDARSKNTELIIDNQEYKIIPYVPLNKERFLVILSGESGSGKTLLSSLMTEQYMRQKNKKIFYVCATSYKDDENMKKMPFTQLDTENIDEYKIEEFTDSLIVFDDNDYNNDLKKIMKFLNKIVETGRKFGVNLIFCTHIHSRLNMSPIYRETDLYITFPNSLINNLMIEQNLKIDKNIVEELKQENHAFICFNKIYRTIITDSIIFKF